MSAAAAGGRSSGAEQAAAKLRVASAMRPRCREALQEPWACERSQLASQRLPRCDEQVAQLTELGALGVDRSLPCGDERLQRLTFATCARRRRTVRGEDAARGTDRVERVGLPAGARLPAQPADLAHPLLP